MKSVKSCGFIGSKAFSSMVFLIQDYFYFISGWVDLHCCPWDLSSCSEWGLLFVALHRLLIAVASFVVQALGCTGFSSCGFQALEHRLNSWVHGLSCM